MTGLWIFEDPGPVIRIDQNGLKKHERIQER